MRAPRAVSLQPVVLPVLAAVLVAGGCSGGSDAPAPSPTPDLGTPLADVATRKLAVARGDWCSSLPDDAVERTLGGPARRTSSYGNGDRVTLGDGVRDVVHEYSCSFVGAGGATARAWVFAPPVTPARAQSLVRAARNGRGCRAIDSAAGFGQPSVATRCTTDGLRRITYQGLFGDAWLSCSLTEPTGGPEADLADRADRWCAAVAQTAASG